MNLKKLINVMLLVLTTSSSIFPAAQSPAQQVQHLLPQLSQKSQLRVLEFARGLHQEEEKERRQAALVAQAQPVPVARPAMPAARPAAVPQPQTIALVIPAYQKGLESSDEKQLAIRIIQKLERELTDRQGKQVTIKMLDESLQNLPGNEYRGGDETPALLFRIKKEGGRDQKSYKREDVVRVPSNHRMYIQLELLRSPYDSFNAERYPVGEEMVDQFLGLGYLNNRGDLEIDFEGQNGRELERLADYINNNIKQFRQ